MGPNSLEKIYCFAPWTHAFINTRGKRNLCCFRDYSAKAETKADHIPLSEYWNSEEMKTVRLEMLKNRPPKECFPCQKHIFFNDHPRHFFFNNQIITEKTIRENTDANGATTLRPVFFDYRFSNLCQFACRMCDGLSSSRIEKIFADTQTSVENLVRPFLTKQVLPEILAALEANEIDRLYWAGGEPLLASEHWQVMNRAIEIGRAHEIEVIYNTNLALLKTPEGDLLNLIPQFKHTRVLASCDGVGEMGEFIRAGLNWRQFKENLISVRALEKAEVVLTITITLPGLLEIEKLAQFILDHDFSYDVHFASANGAHEIFCPLILPRHLLEPLVMKAVSRLQELNDKRLESLIQNCEKILTHQTLAERVGLQFESEFFLHRKRYLDREKKENNQKQTLGYFFNKHDNDLYRWWATEPPIHIDKKEKTQRLLQLEWERRHLKFTVQRRVAYLYREDHPLLRKWREQKSLIIDFIQINKLNSIPSDCYECLIITNEDISISDITLLKEKLKKGGSLSIIAPVNTWLNRFLNRKDPNVIDEKTRFHHNAQGFSLHLLPAFSYMARQREWPSSIISLIKILEWFIPKRFTSLHGHFFWQKR